MHQWIFTFKECIVWVMVVCSNVVSGHVCQALLSSWSSDEKGQSVDGRPLARPCLLKICQLHMYAVHLTCRVRLLPWPFGITTSSGSVINRAPPTTPRRPCLRPVTMLYLQVPLSFWCGLQSPAFFIHSTDAFMISLHPEQRFNWFTLLFRHGLKTYFGSDLPFYVFIFKSH